MVDPLIIIKFGGSAITYKNSSVPKMRKSVLKDLCIQLATLYKTHSKKIILVHGAGSFAHPLAKKFDLKHGCFTDDQLLVAAQINNDMQELNTYITWSLLALGIPAVGLAPHAFITQKDTQLEDMDTQIIAALLQGNSIPILYGDMVNDSVLNRSIISGDTIVPYLADKLSAEKVIYISDVHGVYKQNPKDFPNAEHIELIKNENYEKIQGSFSSHNPHDVTGEMANKLQHIKEHLTGKEVYIVSGFVPNVLVDVVNNKKIGTKILFTCL